MAAGCSKQQQEAKPTPAHSAVVAQPASQIAFIQNVYKYSGQYETATNDAQRKALLNDLGADAAKLLGKSVAVENWVGNVGQIEHIKVKPGGNIAVFTLNIAAQGKPVIIEGYARNGSEVFQTLVKSNAGDRVCFSGKFSPLPAGGLSQELCTGCNRSNANFILSSFDMTVAQLKPCPAL